MQNQSCRHLSPALGESLVPLGPSRELNWCVRGLSWRQTSLGTHAVRLCSAISPCVGPGQRLPQGEGEDTCPDVKAPASPSVWEPSGFYGCAPRPCPLAAPSALVNLLTETEHSHLPCSDGLTAGRTSLHGLGLSPPWPKSGHPGRAQYPN